MKGLQMNLVKRLFIALTLTLMLFVAWSGLLIAPAHAAFRPQIPSCVSNEHSFAHPKESSDPIFGLYFCQNVDAVHIVYINHQVTDVTDETFGTDYTDAATAGCLQYVQTLVMVRYRQGLDSSWVVDCYYDPAGDFVSIPGSEFGQSTIDAAVCRAQQIVYGTCISTT